MKGHAEALATRRFASRSPRSSFSPYDAGAGVLRRRVADADAAETAAAAVDGSRENRVDGSASVPRLDAAQARASPASGRMLSTVALLDTCRAKSRRRNAMPRAARELDPGLDASEPARQPRGDPASGRPGDADTSSDSSDDDSCALIGVVNPGAPLGVFREPKKKENCSRKSRFR